jgi:uncharacterized protein YdhG (YjbR/CyaY superfamily)
MKLESSKTVDEYIATFPAATQTLLEQIRAIIKQNAPEAKEEISYKIAGYKLHGMLVYFAGFKNHVAIYPAPRAHEAFKIELLKYKGGKGTVQFPLNELLPSDLIARIVKHRVKENLAKAAFNLQ